MLEKLNAWLDKPWTNRTYLRWLAIVVAVYTTVMGMLAIVWKFNDWIEEKTEEEKKWWADRGITWVDRKGD